MIQESSALSGGQGVVPWCTCASLLLQFVTPRFQEEFPAKLTKQRFEFPRLNESTFGVGFESPILQSLVQCARVDPALSPKTPSLLLPVEEVPGKVRKRRWRSGKGSLWYPDETLATGFCPKPCYTPPFHSDQQSDSFLVLWVVG